MRYREEKILFFYDKIEEKKRKENII